jgi:hypothetical protein
LRRTIQRTVENAISKGILKGEFLAILPGFTAFRSNALDFWPEAKVWSP